VCYFTTSQIFPSKLRHRFNVFNLPFYWYRCILPQIIIIPLHRLDWGWKIVTFLQSSGKLIFKWFDDIGSFTVLLVELFRLVVSFHGFLSLHLHSIKLKLLLLLYLLLQLILIIFLLLALHLSCSFCCDLKSWWWVETFICAYGWQVVVLLWGAACFEWVIWTCLRHQINNRQRLKWLSCCVKSLTLRSWITVVINMEHGALLTWPSEGTILLQHLLSIVLPLSQERVGSDYNFSWVDKRWFGLGFIWVELLARGELNSLDAVLGENWL